MTRTIEMPDRKTRTAILFVSALIVCLAALTVNSASAQTVLGRDDPMIEAIKDGDLDQVKTLVIQGGNPTISSFDGLNGVSIAARNADYPMLDYLIRVGVSVNTPDNIGNTALHWVTEGADYDMARYLLDEGANLNATNRNGMTPIMLATRAGLYDFVELYVDHGADLGVRDYTGRSVLDWARGSRSPGLEELLIRSGAQ